MDTPIKLNLGAGRRPLAGYHNVEIKEGQQAYPLPQYADNSVDEIRASHLLEHFPACEVRNVLREWYRVLKPGGLLRVAVPDFEKIVKAYLAGEPIDTQAYVMGGQTDEHDFHKCIFDEELLRELLEETGFEGIERWDGDNGDCSTLPTSLNLQGRKRAMATGPFDWLRVHATNVYSQHGEDGIIAALLDKLPQDRLNHVAIELLARCGASDSCTRALVERRGYRAVWIITDAIAAKVAAGLVAGTEHQDKVTVLHHDTTTAALAEVMRQVHSPDVLSISVNGDDFHIWKAVPPGHAPKIVVVAYDPSRKDETVPPLGSGEQAGIEALVGLAEEKGYDVICQLPRKAICVRTELRSYVVDPSYKEPQRDRVIGKDVAAVMSLPRLAFTDNMCCAMEALTPLGIRLSRSSGVFWGQCLTDMIEQAIAAGYTYILTIDYDTVFSSDDVRKLYRLMEEHPEADAICAMQMKRSSNHALFTIQSRDGSAITELPFEALEEELLRVHTAHFGLTIFRAAAFADVEKPWFIGRPDQEGRWTQPIIKDNRTIGGKLDEDIHFWVKWQAAGKTLYQANKVTVGHLQLMVTWPGIDMQPVYQHIYDYNKHGKPKEGVR